MKKIYIIKDSTGGIHKIFSNPNLADKYMNQIMADNETLFHELIEPEEYEIEQ